MSAEAQQHLTLKHQARERALPKSRQAIRNAANAIRAAHRADFLQAEKLLGESGRLLSEMAADLRGHLDIYYAGFVADAQKEYAEAAITVALIRGQAVPMPGTLGVEWAPYLNGLGEACGELRRHVLDRMRQGHLEGCDRMLDTMDDIYSALISLDFPDAITGNLRRTTDSVRGIVEKTRGDLTFGANEARLSALVESLDGRISDLLKKLQG
jgi:translin